MSFRIHYRVWLLNMVFSDLQMVQNAKSKRKKTGQPVKPQDKTENRRSSGAKRGTSQTSRTTKVQSGAIPPKPAKKKPLKRTRVKRKPMPKKTEKDDMVPAEVKWLQEDPQDQLLSRFVETPKGTVVGESIGIEKSKIILKNKLKFFTIPLKSIKEKDDKLVLKRKVDWSRAERLGEAWRKGALDVIPGKVPNKPKISGVKKSRVAKKTAKRKSKKA